MVHLLLENIIESTSELNIFSAEVIVDVVEPLRVGARKRIFRVVAHKLGLIENAANSADEGPHVHLRNALLSFVRQAHVEDLAVVAGVSVVTELTTSTIESIIDVVLEYDCGI